MGRASRRILRGLSELSSVWEMNKDKNFFARVGQVIYLNPIFDPFFDAYYNTRAFVRNCIRVIQFIPYAWNHRDWDYGYILRFNHYLHKRLYDGVFTNGCHVYTEKDTRRLKTVINLLARLEKEDYNSARMDLIDAKYGEWQVDFEPCPGKEGERGLTTMVDKRKQRLTPEQQLQYERDKKRMYELEEYQMKQDLELLGKTIAKYSRKWWD